MPSCLKLIPRQATGSRASRRLRSCGLVPGTVMIGRQLLAVAACEASIKRLAYRQQINAVLNGVKATLLLTKLQLGATSRRPQHVEYVQVSTPLALTHAPTLFVDSGAPRKAASKLKPIARTLTTVSSTRLVPNYIKVKLAGFEGCSRVEFEGLSHMGVMITSASPKQLIAS